MEPELLSKGGRLVIVGNGAPAHAQRFEDNSGLIGQVFTDPAKHTYRALGMKHGLVHTFNLDTVRNAFRAYRAGFRQKRQQGDPWQQGGTAVFDQQGRLVFLHVAEAAGDHAERGALLAALDALRTAA